MAAPPSRPLPAPPPPPSRAHENCDPGSMQPIDYHPPPYTPPSPNPPRQNIKGWWRTFAFVQKAKKDLHKDDGIGSFQPVFGAPLRESLKYASVQISTADPNGQLYVWGDIPVVVAKCGLYLKENATEIEGTFRVSGSSKRMRDLQAVFETPPKYGKNLDWKQENYTPHDVASVFRRYLTQMPEPVIPHSLYAKFREPLAKNLPQNEVIKIYKQLIRSMPRPNQYLLLYVLDLLSVFARKADKNLMTATNLAVIFRPGLISHPNHELAPKEHQLSQRVLEFLIEHQDWFMLDVPPPSPPPPPPHDMEESGGFLGPSLKRGSREKERKSWDKAVRERHRHNRENEEIGEGSLRSAEGAPGWSLVRRANSNASALARKDSSSKRTRRRRSSTSGADSGAPALEAISPLSPLTLSPLHDSTSSSAGNMGGIFGSVSRSRTLPVRRQANESSSSAATTSGGGGLGIVDSQDGKNGPTERDHRERNVLKKQKRSSVQPQRSPPGPPSFGGSGGAASNSSEKRRSGSLPPTPS